MSIGAGVVAQKKRDGPESAPFLKQFPKKPFQVALEWCLGSCRKSTFLRSYDFEDYHRMNTVQNPARQQPLPTTRNDLRTGSHARSRRGSFRRRLRLSAHSTRQNR